MNSHQTNDISAEGIFTGQVKEQVLLYKITKGNYSIERT